MESFPLFFRIRGITFTCMILSSFLWLVLLCVEAFARWSVSDQVNRSLMILFILTNTITLIMLPILILVEFRVWLDAARLLLLFVLQVGSATAGTYWSPKVQCPDLTPDDIGVCQLIGTYTLIACWIIPAILIFYSIYFAALIYLQSRIPVIVEPKSRLRVDLESSSTDSLSLWREKIREIIAVQGSGPDTNVPSRSLVLPSMACAGPSSQPQSSTLEDRTTSPDMPCCQSTMSSLPHAGQQSISALPSMPSRYQSLPVPKRSSAPYLRPLSISRPITHASTSQLPTSSSHTYTTPSPASPGNQSFSVGPSGRDAQFARDLRGCSRHLSMMPLSSSPGKMRSTEGSPTTPCSSRSRLSKPAPTHLM